jgi:hypothetical protein
MFRFDERRQKDHLTAVSLKSKGAYFCFAVFGVDFVPVEVVAVF